MGEEFSGLVQRARGVAVAVGLDLLSPASGGGNQLREGGEETTGDVGVLDELAQDRGELRGVDVVGVEVVLDLLQGELGDADRGPQALQAPTGAGGHRLVALVVAMRAATVSQPWCHVLSRWKAPFMPKSARR